MTEGVSITSTDGLTLEAEIDAVPEAEASLLLCHPHPKMGGTMNAPLLLAIRDEMVRRSWNILRFNFRGIGSSEGHPSTGVEEVADAQGGLGHLRERFQAPMAIAGWSFGAAVAVRTAAGIDDLLGCVAIAPAVEEKPDITAGLPPARDLGISVPLLVVVGANDEEVNAEAVRAWAGELDKAIFELVPGANHFFWARYELVSNMVGDFLDGRLDGGDGE
ncbi:MAG: alpha/beta hydrolase [Actinomycetota bacterium]